MEVKPEYRSIGCQRSPAPSKEGVQAISSTAVLASSGDSPFGQDISWGG